MRAVAVPTHQPYTCPAPALQGHRGHAQPLSPWSWECAGSKSSSLDAVPWAGGPGRMGSPAIRTESATGKRVSPEGNRAGPRAGAPWLSPAQSLDL